MRRPCFRDWKLLTAVETFESGSGFAAVHWKVQEFALIAVDAAADGVQYRVVETFPLQ